MFQLRDGALPSVTIEAAWAESYPKLREDMRVWMEGAAGVRVCLLVMLNRRANNSFEAYVEVARQSQIPGAGWAFDPRQVSCNTLV